MKPTRFSVVLLLWMCAISLFCAELSSSVSAQGVLETRSAFGAQLVRGTVRLSPVAEAASETPALEIDGQSPGGWSAESPMWDSTEVDDGRYSATLTEGEDIYTATLAVRNSPEVAVHGGMLEADETWGAEQVHIVQYVTRVPSGRTLTIVDDAVVKFCEGTRLIVDEGGKLVLGACVFTHVADDTAGGDTNLDGNATTPVDGGYELVINGEVDTLGYQPTLCYLESSGLIRQIVTKGCREGNFLALAGQPVTLNANYAGSLEACTFTWRSVVPTDLEFVVSKEQLSQVTFVVPVEGAMVECVVHRADGESSACSAFGVLETRSTFGAQLVHDMVRLSPVAEAAFETPTLEIDGQSPGGWSAESPMWDSTEVDDERYSAMLTEGEDTYTATLAVRNSPEVAVHGGMLEADEIWGAEQVHIVQYVTRVPSGRTLTIVDGAVVKFCEGTRLIVDEGGKLVLGACVFTHIADDTYGGDTNLDGAESIPTVGAYDLAIAGEVDYSGDSPKFIYAAEQDEWAAVTLEGCTESAFQAVPGLTVTLTAELPEGLEESEAVVVWSIEPSVEFAQAGLSATFTMPGEAVSVTATVTARTYAVTVSGGTADVSEAAKGETVTVTAELPDGLEAGDCLLRWDFDPAVEYALDGARASFTMPGEAVAATVGVIPLPIGGPVVRALPLAVIPGEEFEVTLEADFDWLEDAVGYIVTETLPPGVSFAGGASELKKHVSVQDGTVSFRFVDDPTPRTIVYRLLADDDGLGEALPFAGTVEFTYGLDSMDTQEVGGDTELTVLPTDRPLLRLERGWNAVFLGMEPDEATTQKLLQRSRAVLTLNTGDGVYLQASAFAPDVLYWLFVEQPTAIALQGKAAETAVPTGTHQWLPYGNLSGERPEGYDVFEWGEERFHPYDGDMLVPGSGYFLRKQD